MTFVRNWNSVLILFAIMIGSSEKHPKHRSRKADPISIRANPGPSTVSRSPCRRRQLVLDGQGWSLRRSREGLCIDRSGARRWNHEARGKCRRPASVAEDELGPTTALPDSGMKLLSYDAEPSRRRACCAPASAWEAEDARMQTSVHRTCWRSRCRLHAARCAASGRDAALCAARRGRGAAGVFRSRKALLDGLRFLADDEIDNLSSPRCGPRQQPGRRWSC